MNRALVTGASSGIGEALAIELAARGASVVLAARSVDKLREVQRQIRAKGGAATVLELDVADTDEAVRRIRAFDDRSPIDLVIANAGVGENKNGDPPYAWEVVKDAFHTNVCGAVATLTAIFPRFIARRGGHLVGIGSLSAYGALPGALAYSAPKAGLKMALDCLRLDGLAHGVAVTHVELGFIRTRMLAVSERSLPQIKEPRDAARLIVRELRRRPRRIVYPRALAIAARGLAMLPEPVRELIARRISS